MRSSVALAFAGARSTPSATRPPSAVPADARRKSRRETRILHPPVQGWIAVRVRPYHVEKIRQEPQTPIRGNTDIAMQWSRLANDARDGERELPAHLGRVGEDVASPVALAQDQTDPGDVELAVRDEELGAEGQDALLFLLAAG